MSSYLSSQTSYDSQPSIKTPVEGHKLEKRSMSGFQGLNDFLFGTLGKEYCLYFYLLSVGSYIISAFIFLSLMFMAVTDYKKVDSKVIFAFTMASATWFIIYFQNRLLHTMCVESGSPTQ